MKCELNNINYVPVAVLHSQMVKQGAVGGYVISVRDFEQSAKKHVEGINIQLINGKELVNMWLHPVYKKSFLEELIDAIKTRMRNTFSEIVQDFAKFIKNNMPFNINKDKPN